MSVTDEQIAAMVAKADRYDNDIVVHRHVRDLAGCVRALAVEVRQARRERDAANKWADESGGREQDALRAEVERLRVWSHRVKDYTRTLQAILTVEGRTAQLYDLVKMMETLGIEI